MVFIRQLNWPEERTAWLRLRQALWPDAASEELEREMDEFWQHGVEAAVWVAARPDNSLAGLAEIEIRPWATGCDSRPVPYLEAWYVDEDVRQQGVGRALVAAAEQWAIDHGYTEMGSDALLDNEISHAAHRALGFTEVERLVLFSKRLKGNG